MGRMDYKIGNNRKGGNLMNVDLSNVYDFFDIF